MRNLQEFIGATTDGVYGPATRRAHVAELTARGLSTNAVPLPPVPAPGDSNSSEASPPATAAPDTSPSPTATSPTAAPSTTVRQPVGTLEFASCSDCGQSLSSGSCANWVAYPVNSSDTSIEAMYFSPPGGEWWQYRYSSEVAVDANAAAVTVPLNLAPGEGSSRAAQRRRLRPPTGRTGTRHLGQFRSCGRQVSLAPHATRGDVDPRETSSLLSLRTTKRGRRLAPAPLSRI